MRLPEFLENQHMKVAMLSALRTGRLYAPEDIPGKLRLKCDGTRAENRFRLSAKRTSPFESAGTSVQSTTGSQEVRISGSIGSNDGYTILRGSVKCSCYTLHSTVSPSHPLPCVTVCHHFSTRPYSFLLEVEPTSRPQVI